ncbi:MAG: hypothetical protein K1X81_01830 [Bacteroidia bacterium]|nr:hypothetical protein [Bacteroidia bacterium]
MAKTFRDEKGENLTPAEVDANFRDCDAQAAAAMTAANGGKATYTGSDVADMLDKPAKVGDTCKVTDLKATFRLTALPASEEDNWEVIGIYELPEIVDNLTTNDASKVLSAKQGKALQDGKAALVHTHSQGDITGLAAALASKVGYDITGKVALSDLPDSILGATKFKGVWNANTNVIDSEDEDIDGGAIPAASSGNVGWYLIVTTAGSTTVDGINEWGLGDWIISIGTAWKKVDNTDAVITVNGQVGAVVLDADDIAETATRKWVSTSEKTTWNGKEDATNKVGDLSSPNTNTYIHTQGLDTILAGKQGTITKGVATINSAGDNVIVATAAVAPGSTILLTQKTGTASGDDSFIRTRLGAITNGVSFEILVESAVESDTDIYWAIIN